MAIAIPASSVVQPANMTVTVVHLQHTGHVLAALTRATSAPPASVGDLTGNATFPLAEPGASGLVLVPANLISAAELGAPPGVLTAFWRWYVDTGGQPGGAAPPPVLKQVSGVVPDVDLNAGSLAISSPGDGQVPVLAVIHPAGQWGAGVSIRFEVRSVLDANGKAQLGNGAVTLTDEALVFVRGRPVAVYVPGHGN